MGGRSALLMLWVASCGYPQLPALTDDARSPADAPIDTLPPITCGALTCDPNATCPTTGVAMCLCKAGFTGNGMSCADIDECATANGGCAAACMNTSGSFVCYAPRTCTDIKSHVSGAADGTYPLYLGGDAAKPWQGYCAGMATTPREYLSLTGMNFAQYTQGGHSPGTDVKTTYTKVRFDPASQKIDISDRTFASSTGMLDHSGLTQVTTMPYGVAMDCRGVGSATGLALIDLTGTAFALTGASEFGLGPQSVGNIQLGSGNQRATITGGGGCGWNGPNGLPSNPFNNNVTSGAILPLVYAP